MPTALLSAYDKTGLPEFARTIFDLGWRILASDGTAKLLGQHHIGAENINSIVGKPILGHRVVTLSRQIHAALLAKDTPEDNAELKRIGMPRIDLVYVSLYPLEVELAKSDKTLDSVLEMTDIGGPAMLMAGIKGKRLVLAHPGDLLKIIPDLRDGDWKSVPLRCRYAGEAIERVRNYYLQLLPVIFETAQLPT